MASWVGIPPERRLHALALLEFSKSLGKGRSEMVFKLYINTDNAAFVPDPTLELGLLLHRIAERVGSGEDISKYLTIFDSNGNDVGRFALKDEPAP